MPSHPDDDDDVVGDGVDDLDEHLYWHPRRASQLTLSSTTTASSSGPSSPTFSRRGSRDHNAHFNPILPPPIPTHGTRLANGHASRDGVAAAAAAHPDAPRPYNYDGIIKHPSRHSYARSNHYHPYGPYSPQPSPQHGHYPPPPGHPYYSQKRHSFAALRTANSPSAHAKMSSMTTTTATNNETSLPQVRLPSIDHSLPPFSHDAGMIAPIRRGSLTDPLLHAHNSSSSAGLSLLAGPSGTSPYTSIGRSLSPNTSLKPHFGNTGYPPSSSHESAHVLRNEGNPPRLGSAGAPPQPPTQQEALPFFKKSTKTLFPQQHGGSLGSISPSSESNANVNVGLSGTPSLLGIKRKLEPLSESDSLHNDRGPTGAGGDYFSGSAAAVELMRNNSTTPRGHPQHLAGEAINAIDMQAINAAKRRASQPFIKAANLGNGTSESLPTPVSMVFGSANGASQSASSSERRSSNESSNDAAANNVTNPNLSLRGSPEEAKHNKETPRYATGPHPSEEVMEADARTGYAFPIAHRPPPLHLEDARVSPSLETAYYDNQISTSPYATRSYPPPPSSTSNQHVPSYGPASVQTRLPAHGAPSVDLRSKASTVFGPAVNRPSYTSDGIPVLSEHNGGVGGNGNAIEGPAGMPARAPAGPGGMGTTCNGPSSSMKEATLHHNALLQIQQQELQEQQGGGSSSGSNQPYARSPALKVSHKIAERKRRKEMKELFDELRDCIPAMSASSTLVEGFDADGNPIAIAAPPPPPPADVGGRGIKSSKWEVLAKAVEYINKLQFENSELSNSVIELQRLNQAFQDELALVRSGGGGGSSAIGAVGPGHGTSSMLGMEGMNDLGPSGAGVPHVVHFQQQQENNQLYPHPQHPQHQHQHQQAPVSNYHGTSANPSPSPVSVHSMPPLIHHSHSMPAAVGTGSGTHTPHPASLSVHHSPIQPQVYPISAPPHMASQSFFSPNEAGHNQQFQFAQPTPRQFHQQHSRNASLNSNGGGAASGHFEHAGSAPPALQHHPHQLLQQQQQASMGGGSNHGSPLGQHQNVQIFAHQPSSLSNDVQQQPSYALQHQARPGSMRSHHSNQSVLSGGHSQSPQPVHGVMQQQQQHHEAWVGSPYQQQPQQIRGSTIPPGSAQGTPMMSPMNSTY